jgi:hypothetical protein
LDAHTLRATLRFLAGAELIQAAAVQTVTPMVLAADRLEARDAT